MKLTKLERVQLINQCSILEKLYPDDKTEYAKYRKALEQGFTRDYGDIVEYLWEEVSAEECQEVIDILQLYRVITFSVYELRKKNQEVDITDEDIAFEGFDMNDDVESKYGRYTKYYIKDLGKYDELNNEYIDFNSHCPMLDRYREMLYKWEILGGKQRLTVEQIKDILNL